jgi:glycolate dehydrogenase FAD-binding subunit
MTMQLAALESALGTIVGAEWVRPAGPEDAVAGVPPAWVVEPEGAGEVAAVLRAATAAGAHLAPRGGGTKMGWGLPPRALDAVVSLRRLDAVLEHAWGDLTVTVQAGCSVSVVQQTVAQHGQRVAVDPLWPDRATMGGILAANDTGALRLRFGGLRDLVLGVTIALPDGTLARSGGKVVKNVAGYDLPKLMTGALGTLGVIVEATFRLYPLPAATRTFTVRAATPAALNTLILRVLDSTLVPTGIQLRVDGDGAAAADVRFEGITGALDIAAAHFHDIAATLGCGDALAEADPAVWQTREDLWADSDGALIAKVSTLPAQLAACCATIAQAAGKAGARSQVVLQANGLGLLRLDGAEPDALLAAGQAIRAALEAGGGSLVILRCPPAALAHADIWGAPGDSLPLMQRIKAQFDPTGTLNPGRFIGGI